MLFIASHIPFFGWDWLLYFGPGTIAIYVIYLWRKNLIACILLHFLIDAPILIPTILTKLR